MNAKKLWRATILVIAAVTLPYVAIPTRYGDTAFGSASTERELAEGWVQSVYRYTGSTNGLTWEFTDVRTGLKYRIKKGDGFRGRFADGSSVRFAFRGFAIGCPSPGCFTWVVGTERQSGYRLGSYAVGGNDHYVYLGQPYDGYIGARDGGTCADGNLDKCPKGR